MNRGNPASLRAVQASVSAYDVLVVGAGLAGSTIAERCASEFGANVLLIDRRPHLAGNCHDPVNADGLQYHQYGPHVFHTNSEDVIDYLSAFTAWRPYEHRVLANVDGRLLPIPINRTTINGLYGLDLDERGVTAFLDRVAGRTRALRALLCRLYAQALGTRSLRPRRERLRPHSDPHQHRRPLLQRPFSADAGGRLHRDGGAHDAQPAHRAGARRRLL